nr:zinc finger protein 488 [Pogona vitticeps]
MRLVQAAASKKEQNLEACLKNSQLYYWVTRKILRNEELLVWYEEELSRLLGFSEIKICRRFQNELDCPNCKWEHACLSQACFFSFPENSTQLWRKLSVPKMVKDKSMEQPTHSCSLDRDLEFRATTWKDGSCRERRRNHDEMESSSKSRKSVLLEKTNYLHEEQPRDKGMAQHLLGGPFWKFGTVKQMALKKDVLEQKESAFTEVKRMKVIIENSKKAEDGTGGIFLGKNIVQCSPGSAFSFVWPTRAPGEPKSAFSKPVKALVDTTAAVASRLSDPMKGPGKLSGCLSAADLVQYRSLLTSKFLASDLNNSRLLQTTFLQNSPFLYPSEMWSRQMKEPRQTTPTSTSSSPTLTVLPPTFTSFGVASQNWCAKCNLSFRMTSDLVLHMRSHHKKEGPSPESHGKRRQEEKLSCPVCQEYFRERHHLSRHMTSHN